MELAYRLAVEDSPVINAIRENVIVTITPVAEPDGRDRYVDWYYRHKIDETGEEDSHRRAALLGQVHLSRQQPRHQLFAGDDAQRCWTGICNGTRRSCTICTSRCRSFTPSAARRRNSPTLDPILYGELPWFSNFEMAQMIKYGMPGVWTHGFVDMWSPGYLGFMSSNHNGMLRMYETFGNGGANTMKRARSPDRARHRRRAGVRPTSREWYRPSPPLQRSRLVDAQQHQLHADRCVLSALQLTSPVSQSDPRKLLSARAAIR